MAGVIRNRWLRRDFILQALAIFVVGSLVGVGAFTFIFARGYSYLTNDPAACINCHVMEDQYRGWTAGSHSNAATCNDCHAPHDNLLHKYYVKAENGFWHGLMFTTGLYPENIQIRETNARVTNDACLYCHADITADMRLASAGEEISCLRCHADVGHK